MAELGHDVLGVDSDEQKIMLLSVAAAVHTEGAAVRIHDPWAIENARAACPQLDYADDVLKACEDADVVLHLTEWQEYRKLDPARIREVVRAPRILDARNVLIASSWLAAGWELRSMGARPAGF